ncbi:MAG TPA: transketolase [Longimicrobiales bacterium]|nr:transketolase [Longimicrobiales bacterium]
MANSSLDDLCINTIRFLAVDAVEKAGSGHPGLPMGAAALGYTLWDRHLRFNPRDPKWFNRDRFVLSAGHGCMLQYALLHLTGFDLPLAEIERFRQWDSMTPGHPEYGRTPGIEATTGPLGQGFGNGVGMAIAERVLAAHFNRPGHAIIDHHTYVLASDGDLMEGVSSEAASLAGHLGLGKLIVLYADNHVSIEGNTALAFTEDRTARFAAYDWHTQDVDAFNDVEALDRAIQNARAETGRPSFIRVRTHIGFGSPNKQDRASAHGEPLGPDEVRRTKENLGWPLEPTFHIPDEARAHFREAVERGERWQEAWNERLRGHREEYPRLAAELDRMRRGDLPSAWEKDLPTFNEDDGPLATRDVNGAVLNGVARQMSELIGGSADLAPSTRTLIGHGGDFSADQPGGRNLHFGVREHAMGAILNGMALHGGLRPFGATFLIFSDYMRPPMRLAAMNGLPVLYVFTHDSIGLGEDGPTHQPVEQLVGLRAVPGLTLFRPADANEAVEAWRAAIKHQAGPVAMVCTRQKLPVLAPKDYPALREGVARGGYVLADGPDPDVVLVGTGSEVHLALSARDLLAQQDVRARVVSMPSLEVFAEQAAAYRQEVLPPGVPVLSIEAGRTLGWIPYLGHTFAAVGLDHFGASAPGERVMREFGFTPEHVRDRALELVREMRGVAGLAHHDASA